MYELEAKIRYNQLRNRFNQIKLDSLFLRQSRIEDLNNLKQQF